jgi:hypothetical protein
VVGRSQDEDIEVPEPSGVWNLLRQCHRREFDDTPKTGGTACCSTSKDKKVLH